MDPLDFMKFKIEGDCVITNYDTRNPLPANFSSNGIKVVIENGKYSGKKSIFGTNVNENIDKYYTIFQKVASMDGNNKDLTLKDLKEAKARLTKECSEVKDVRFDEAAGVATIITKDSKTLRIDFETTAEKKIKNIENNAQKEAQALKKQIKGPSFNKNTLSLLSNVSKENMAFGVLSYQNKYGISLAKAIDEELWLDIDTCKEYICKKLYEQAQDLGIKDISQDGDNGYLKIKKLDELEQWINDASEKIMKETKNKINKQYLDSINNKKANQTNSQTNNSTTTTSHKDTPIRKDSTTTSTNQKVEASTTTAPQKTVNTTNAAQIKPTNGKKLTTEEQAALDIAETEKIISNFTGGNINIKDVKDFATVAKYTGLSEDYIKNVLIAMEGYEKFPVLKSYYDGVGDSEHPNGYLTIGFGHTSLSGKPKISRKDYTITEQQAFQILANDIIKARNIAKNKLGDAYDKAPQSLKDAIVDMVFNKGEKALNSSLIANLDPAKPYYHSATRRTWYNTKNNGLQKRNVYRFMHAIKDLSKTDKENAIKNFRNDHLYEILALKDKAARKDWNEMCEKYGLSQYKI